MNVTGIEQGSYFLGRLSSVLGGRDLLPYLGELHASPLPRRFEEIVADEPAFETKRFTSIWQLRLYRVWVYCLVRALRPAVFVETGVLHGMTSAFVLEAMRVNGRGRLISIDLPSYAETGPANRDGYTGTLPPGREPGWLVPEELRGRWELHLGASLDLLPGILDGLDRLDVFLHDSDHTYETMRGEFELAWPKLAEGGALIADDSTDNTAFAELCERVGRTPLLFPNPNEQLHDEARCGLILK
ncbi:MAG: class I SAM-dependent methyltransferase [Solirubrobacteraceae bacterium]|nr:class I SAM-dependent methyltransferase [Solirubrobacteraceae bacterium]